MADDANELPPPEENATAPAPEARPVAPPSRSRETWEVQQRAPKRPDFAGRLAKTSDLPTEQGKARVKSRLGEHRAAAIRWEEEPARLAERQSEEDEGEVTAGHGLSRAQIGTLAGLGVVVTALGAIWFAKSLLLGEGAVRPPAVAPGAVVSTAPMPVLSDIEYKETTEAMKKFLEAETPEALRAVVREPERVWPLVMAYHENTPWRPYTVRTLPTKTEVRLNGSLLAGSVEVDDFQRFIVAMERLPDGAIKVDWETFTGQGEMSWDDLLFKRPSKPVLMRALVKPDDYFNRDFPDSTTHACYQLTSHKDTHRVFGYVERGSRPHALLVARTRVNPRLPLTLRVRYPQGSKSDDQLEITELVADGWLVCETTRIKDTDPAVAPATPPAGTAPATPAPPAAPGESSGATARELPASK